MQGYIQVETENMNTGSSLVTGSPWSLPVWALTEGTPKLLARQLKYIDSCNNTYQQEYGWKVCYIP